MNCNQATSPLVVSAPLTERVAADVLDALHSAALAVAGLWKKNAAPRGEHAFDSIAHLNEYTLKDIGAPDWLVARAAERRDAQHLRWIELEVR